MEIIDAFLKTVSTMLLDMKAMAYLLHFLSPSNHVSPTDDTSVPQSQMVLTLSKHRVTVPTYI